MSNLLGNFQNVSSKNKRTDFDDIAAYEEHYMKLLKMYQPEIQHIEEMLESLREERMSFYQNQLPAIKKAMHDDDVLSEECKAQWIRTLQENMEKSFQTSESLIQHYVTKNLEEFRIALKDASNKV